MEKQFRPLNLDKIKERLLTYISNEGHAEWDNARAAIAEYGDAALMLAREELEKEGAIAKYERKYVVTEVREYLYQPKEEKKQKQVIDELETEMLEFIESYGDFGVRWEVIQKNFSDKKDWQILGRRGSLQKKGLISKERRTSGSVYWSANPRHEYQRRENK